MSRILAAVLAADIVGYSKLVSEDEASALAALRDFRVNSVRPFAAQHRGEIVKSMGDGWLIAFASAQDAVSCAINLQETLEGNDVIKLRIGVHIGDVTYEEDDIFGDGINVAARLEALAPAGGVALSQSAFAALDGTLSVGFRDTGEQSLKNIDRPVRVWLRSPEGAVLSSRRLSGLPALTVEPVIAADERADVQELATGLTADISLYLASIQWLEVGKGYTLTQALRARGDRVRLEARLTSPEGAPIWSGKHDGDLADSFDWQDEVGEEVAAQVYGQVLEAERAKSARIPFENMTGEQLLFRALMEFRSLTENDIRTALHYGAEAIKRAPSLTQAYAASMSFLLMGQLLRFDWTRSYEERAVNWLKAARPLAAENPLLELFIAFNDYMRDGDIAHFRAKLEMALARAPSNVEVLMFGGWSYAFIGQADQALACFSRYRKLGRLCPYWVQGLAGAAVASVQIGRDEDALIFAKQGLELTNGYGALYLYVASAAGHLGRTEEALTALDEIQLLMPGLTMSQYAATTPWTTTETGRRYLQGLRLAGLPE